jgi:NTE family protein
MRVRCFFFSVLISCSANYAQQPNPRVKIGLALQGGGAKGLAHIGVLQWLEEHHIPIDYLAGTSMGGLVGGLYATGHGPAEIQHIVKEVDWDSVLSGAIPYEALAFRRKQDLARFPTDWNWG